MVKAERNIKETIAEAGFSPFFSAMNSWHDFPLIFSPGGGGGRGKRKIEIKTNLHIFFLMEDNKESRGRNKMKVRGGRVAEVRRHFVQIA